jgi:hypothetical protein
MHPDPATSSCFCTEMILTLPTQSIAGALEHPAFEKGFLESLSEKKKSL